MCVSFGGGSLSPPYLCKTTVLVLNLSVPSNHLGPRGNSDFDLLCPVSGLEIGSSKPSGATLASGLWTTSVYKVTGMQSACKLDSNFWCEWTESSRLLLKDWTLPSCTLHPMFTRIILLMGTVPQRREKVLGTFEERGRHLHLQAGTTEALGKTEI